MTRWKGFNNTTFKTKKLSYGQVKQVQKIVNSNKRLKHYYLPIDNAFQYGLTGGYTPIGTSFQELTLLDPGGASHQRDAEIVNLQSYNIKMGLAINTDDASTPATALLPVGFRIIIVKSKEGHITDITDPSQASIVDWIQQPDPDLYQIYTDEIFNPVAGTANDTASLGYLMKFYKSFKKKKIPHMKVKFDDTLLPSIGNGIFMKIIADPNIAATVSYSFKLTGFCHLKWFDKE